MTERDPQTRDTDPAPAGPDHDRDTDSAVMLARGSLEEQISRLEQLIISAGAVAEHASNVVMRTHEDVRSLTESINKHERRINQLEYRDAWGPYLVSGVVLIVALVALGIACSAYASHVH